MVALRRALLSVSDKTGLVPFADRLVAEGVTLLSTGGTARVLREAGLPVTDVSEYTGAPEVFDGRVKTLHPRIHGGLLGRWDQAADRKAATQAGIEPIGLVVVNLYPFAATMARLDANEADVIEAIDIGGPTLIRAAAKNHAHTAVVCDPADYGRVGDAIAAGTLDGLRQALARKAFSHTASYDAAIARWFDALEDEGELPATLHLAAPRVASLRYGENPHQRAAFYAVDGGPGQASLARAEQLQGKALSYNNLLDLDAALAIAVDLRAPGAVVIKHGNPCGAAEGSHSEALAAVYLRARATDPTSAFGGIVGFNRPVDGATARCLAETFLEAVIAPGFDAESLAILGRKKNLRLLRHDPWPTVGAAIELRRIAGGYLAQDRDAAPDDVRASAVASQRAPTEAEWAALDFAWRVCRHVKSNAIVYARDGALLGVGAGQMSRVDSCRIAAEKARIEGHSLAGSVAASDAFFPFPDGVETLAAAGATAVIQPGGSVRDDDVVAAADRLGLALVMTGVRHFRH